MPVYLTWYGIVTPDIVVDAPTYLTNAATIINYMVQSPIPYKGLLLQLDPPTGANTHSGKPANYATDVDLMAHVIAGVPLGYRVGFHAVLEADATWQISESTILQPDGRSPYDLASVASVNPKLARAGFGGTAWHGGAGAADAGTSPDYSAYQSLFTGWFPGQSPSTGACPYKISGASASTSAPSADDLPGAWPSGCPGNVARLAWYCCLVNARLRQLGSPQRVTMLNWDQEGNGPVGLTCGLYQFLYALEQYGTPEDIYPEIATKDGAMTRGPWVTFLNGGPDLDNTVAYGKNDACQSWSSARFGTPITLSGGRRITTFGQAVTSKGAPEFYWFKGEDMGSVQALGPAGRFGMLPQLWQLGLAGCYQSALGKEGYDKDCGCRATVYQHFANQPLKLLEALAPLYDPRAAAIANSTPTFSIEHLGNTTSTLNYDTCINSLNFCAQAVDKDDNRNTTCWSDAKCAAASCGVANFFGVWDELPFRTFLAEFARRYNAPSLMVYDAGFVPVYWLPDKVSTKLPAAWASIVRTRSYRSSKACAPTPPPPAGLCDDGACECPTLQPRPR